MSFLKLNLALKRVFAIFFIKRYKKCLTFQIKAFLFVHEKSYFINFFTVFVKVLIYIQDVYFYISLCKKKYINAVVKPKELSSNMKNVVTLLICDPVIFLKKLPPSTGICRGL